MTSWNGANVALYRPFRMGRSRKARLLRSNNLGLDTNEIPMIKDLLDPLDIVGNVGTIDALHTQTETARFLVEDKQADHISEVKMNHPPLYEVIAAVELDDYSPRPSPPKKDSTKRIGRHVRGHWGIEIRLHYVRPMAYDEDRPQVRTKCGPQVRATPRNATNGLIRRMKLLNIRRTLQHLGRRFECE